MSEPEPPPSETSAPKTGSWVSVPPFDVGAIEGTASYPVNPTVSFPSTPDDNAADTLTGNGNGDSANVPIASAPRPDPDLPQIPGYKVIRFISDGGMGTVFLARHLAMDKLVALKII